MGHFDLSLPDPMQEWIEDEVVGSDGYADASAYIAELVRRDQQRRGVPMR
jgi:Arc/MetJ-type ribon-helix-helix transcriptional regulator